MRTQGPALEAGRWQDEAPDPLWSRAAQGWRSRHRFLGLTIEVTSHARAMLDVAAAAFGPALPAPTAHVKGDRDATSAGEAADGPGDGQGDGPADQHGDGQGVDASTPDLRLAVIVGPPPGGDGWPADDRGAGRPVLREHGGLFAAFDGAGGMVAADLAAGTATAWVPAHADPERVRTVLLESPVWRLATRRGLLALHAAAILIDDVAVVVRGAAGAGKSSLALAADAMGWPVLAEEVVWIDPQRDVIWPSARHVRLDEPGRAGKRAVPLVTAAPARAAPVGPLVLLDPPRASGDARDGPFERAGASAGARWERLAPAAARARCEAERIVGEHAQPEPRWRAVCDRWCDAGAYRLSGGDPAQRALALAAIVTDRRLSADEADSR